MGPRRGREDERVDGVRAYLNERQRDDDSRPADLALRLCLAAIRLQRMRVNDGIDGVSSGVAGDLNYRVNRVSGRRGLEDERVDAVRSCLGRGCGSCYADDARPRGRHADLWDLPQRAKEDDLLDDERVNRVSLGGGL